MAEKKGVGHAYNIDFLNVVFAASSIFLFLSVIWMVWDDYAREWKTVQRNFVNLEIQVTQAGLHVFPKQLYTSNARQARVFSSDLTPRCRSALPVGVDE